MKQTSFTKTSVTSSDPRDDAPKLTQADFDQANLRLGGRDVNQAEWQIAVRCVIREELSH